jgi:hypothetical protein
MVLPLRLFVGLLLAFWSRVAAAKTSKARRGTESQKAKKWCGLRGRRSQSTATVFWPEPEGRLEVTNAFVSWIHTALQAANRREGDGARTAFNQPGRTEFRFSDFTNASKTANGNPFHTAT